MYFIKEYSNSERSTMKKSHLHPPTLVLLPRADTTNSFLLHPCWKTSAHTQKHVYKSLKHRRRPCCPAPFFSPLSSPEIFLKEQIQMDSETNLAQVPGQKRFSCVLSVPESGPHVEELTREVSATTRVLWLLHKHSV